MAQNSQPLDLEEAQQRLLAELRSPNRSEHLDSRKALGRVLSETVVAPVDLPPFPASAMDGYALSLADWQSMAEPRFRIVGQSLAGHPYSGAIRSGECVRVFTGAVVPDGADQVIVQEEVQQSDADSVAFKPHVPSERFVRPVGHDINAGAEIATAGTLINPFLLGALSAAGVARVPVYPHLRIGVFSTGDELQDTTVPPQDLKPGQIYDSNRVSMMALLQDAVFDLQDLGRLPDDPQQIHASIQAAAAEHDALLTSGGVSVGDADHVVSTIEALGELKFWKLNLKPGKPMAVGSIGDCRIFGLPGNPVSTIVTLLLMARPALLRMAGCTAPWTPLKLMAALQQPLQHRPGRTEYQRGTCYVQDGELQVAHTGDQSSNRLSSFAGANCLIEVDAGLGDLATGTVVPVLPFAGLISAG